MPLFISALRQAAGQGKESIFPSPVAHDEASALAGVGVDRCKPPVTVGLRLPSPRVLIFCKPETPSSGRDVGPSLEGFAFGPHKPTTSLFYKSKYS